MKRHMHEEYFVVGEGMVGAGPDGSPTHRQASTVEEARSFRFSRLGAEGTGIDPVLLEALAVAMTATQPPDPDSANVPAGYTYLGQFVDHDLTKDVTAISLGTRVTVDELLQGRSPALDLDSLYGRGPHHEEDRQFYADAAKLKTGTTSTAGFPANDGAVAQPRQGFDLPRVGINSNNGQTQSQQRLPLIPDIRNDENLAVAQTHVAFIRFHNRVVDHLAEQGVADGRLFATARDLVVRHYQWMLRTDFLPRIVDPAIVDDVFSNGRRVFEVGATYPEDRPTMPIEFSIAAFRLGHSMVRDNYEWNRVFSSAGPGNRAPLMFLFSFTGINGIFQPVRDPLALDNLDTGTVLTLPSNWIADFRRLYDFSAEGRPDLLPPAGGSNSAKRIDTRLVDPLGELPLGAFAGIGTEPALIARNLAFRNLRRANMLRLASGPDMATLMREKGLAIAGLTDAQILEGTGDGVNLSGLTDAQKATLVASTPLWFYILREAELAGGKLSGVGGRIVAEVFHRAMEGSRSSIVRDPDWRPTLSPADHPGRFEMVDLLLFAAGGDAAVINPLGDVTPPVPVPQP